MSTTPTATKNIVEIASSSGDFSALVAAVKAAGLAETLAGKGPFTVFAPIDKAFAALPVGTVDMLLKPENKSQLASILTYHVVPGSLFSNEVKGGDVTTVNGGRFTISLDGGSVILTDARGGKARVIQPDVAASNGVIHIIDSVLLPE